MIIYVDQNRDYLQSVMYLIGCYLTKYCKSGFADHHFEKRRSLIISNIKPVFQSRFGGFEAFNSFEYNVNNIYSYVPEMNYNIIRNDYGISILPPNLNHLRGNESVSLIDLIISQYNLIEDEVKFLALKESEVETAPKGVILKAPEGDMTFHKNYKDEELDKLSQTTLKAAVKYIDDNFLKKSLNIFCSNYDIIYEQIN